MEAPTSDFSAPAVINTVSENTVSAILLVVEKHLTESTIKDHFAILLLEAANAVILESGIKPDLQSRIPVVFAAYIAAYGEFTKALTEDALTLPELYARGCLDILNMVIQNPDEQFYSYFVKHAVEALRCHVTYRLSLIDPDDLPFKQAAYRAALASTIGTTLRYYLKRPRRRFNRGAFEFIREFYEAALIDPTMASCDKIDNFEDRYNAILAKKNIRPRS